MRLAVDCRLIGESGIGTFIENVLEYLVLHIEHQFLLIGNKSKLWKYAERDNCKIIDCRLLSFTPKELLFFPTKEVNQCDAFYSPNFNLPLGIKIPIFSTIQDIVFFETENFGSLFHRAALYWYVKRALKVSQEVFTVSEFSRDRIKEYFKTDKNINVVYNGVRKGLIEYKNSHLKTNKRGGGIVYLGNIKPYKGLRTLWNAYKKLLADGDAPLLTIIGGIDFRIKDDGMIAEIESNKHLINFVSGVSDESLYEILENAEVLVSPSQYEGFGLPPLEALYLNTPVIISDIPVYKEVYGNLPVTFFRVDDVDDLYAKLKSFRPHEENVSEQLLEKYNYKNTANKIIENISNFII